MRVRSQIAVAIVPLFLGLTVVTGALTYYLQVKELSWGLNEESTSIAVAAARLVDAPAVKRLVEGEHGAGGPVREQFRAIISWGRARRLTLLAGADQRVLVDVLDGGAPGPGVAIPPAVVAALEREPFVAGPLVRGEQGASSLAAFAPVRDPAGVLIGILAVEIRADTFTAQRGAILRSVLISLGAATLLGLLLVVFISSMITRRLSELTKQVLQIEAAGEISKSATGFIEEVSDLVNTFDTMKSVFGEVFTRTKRTLIEAEQFRTDEDLMNAYRAEVQPPIRRTIADVEAAGSLFGSALTGSFCGAWELSGGGCAFVGIVGEAKGAALPVAAAAVLAFLEQATRNGDLAPALAAAADLFPLDFCDGVVWRNGGGDASRWSLGRGDGEWRRRAVDVQAGAVVVLHTLDTRAGRRMHTYIGQFQSLPPDALLGEIRKIVAEGPGGALLLLRLAGATQLT